MRDHQGSGCPRLAQLEVGRRRAATTPEVAIEAIMLRMIEQKTCIIRMFIELDLRSPYFDVNNTQTLWISSQWIP